MADSKKEPSSSEVGAGTVYDAVWTGWLSGDEPALLMGPQGPPRCQAWTFEASIATFQADGVAQPHRTSAELGASREIAPSP